MDFWFWMTVSMLAFVFALAAAADHKVVALKAAHKGWY